MGIAILKTLYEYLFAVIYYPVLGLFWLISLPWAIPHKKKVSELKKNHLEIWTVQKHQLLILVSEVDHLHIDNHVVTVVHTDKPSREIYARDINDVLSQAKHFEIKVVIC